MATNDWKPAQQYEGHDKDYGFENKSDDKNFIRIRKIMDGFWVELYRNNERFEDKKFKTKPQAITFAKNYMRTH